MFFIKLEFFKTYLNEEKNCIFLLDWHEIQAFIKGLTKFYPPLEGLWYHTTSHHLIIVKKQKENFILETTNNKDKRKKRS